MTKYKNQKMPKFNRTRNQSKKHTNKQILHKWATKRNRQKGGFFPTIAAIIAAISAGLSAAAPAVASGALAAAAGYATTKALKGIGGKTGAGRRIRFRKTVRRR